MLLIDKKEYNTDSTTVLSKRSQTQKNNFCMVLCTSSRRGGIKITVIAVRIMVPFRENTEKMGRYRSFDTCVNIG